MTSGRDKVEECVHSVIPEARITYDTRLFGQNIIILTFEIPDDVLEAVRLKYEKTMHFRARSRFLRRFVVNVVTETGGVDDGECNSNAVLLEFYGVDFAPT